MRILFVTSEAFPLIKTGGLADVSGSLPAALQEIDADIRILIPGYPAVLDKMVNPKFLTTISNLPHVGAINLIIGEMPETKVPVMAIESVDLYQRDGGPYVDSTGRDWEDNPYRFGTPVLMRGKASEVTNKIRNF